MQECFGLKLFELDNIFSHFLCCYTTKRKSAVFSVGVQLLGEIDLLVKALNTLTYADSSMFYNDMEYCQIVKEILS